MGVADLFTANLKKSVTIAVDPLSVMGFWAVLDIAAGVARELSFNLFVPFGASHLATAWAVSSDGASKLPSSRPVYRQVSALLPSRRFGELS